ncbi:hypothetical protein SAMN02745194_00127 [Roseomonas rosea]|uniref:Glycine-zipper containing OmpA-like membrane domain-containing protein n=1 Tax=Muricoccus roseus TaxID=198092 RepID=A0A1M6AHH6_9PROT|nr:hypothetical protein [Roseomonas rosea]SHI35877.1 hypothetical protein SAMN02745194_00127 [Roseomonas rosea]
MPPRVAFRLAALLTASSLAACAPGPAGPYQQQANSAAYACQQGIAEACQDYQALAPAANAEAYQQQQNAQVGTAVAAGVVGAIAGAAIASSARSDRRHYRGRGYYHRPPHRSYHRHYYR